MCCSPKCVSATRSRKLERCEGFQDRVHPGRPLHVTAVADVVDLVLSVQTVMANGFCRRPVCTGFDCVGARE